MRTAQEIYRREVAPLPVGEQLRLATLILSQVTSHFPPSKDAPVDESDEWSDDDLLEWTRGTHAAFPAMGQGERI